MLIILISIVIIWFLLIYKIFFSEERRIFQYDNYNPYRRYCKKCGQQQDLYTYNLISRFSWWEDMGTINDKSCSCHKYSNYRSI